MADEFSPESVVRRFFAALACHDFARAAGALSEDCHWQSLGTGNGYLGPAPIIEGLRSFVGAFPDWTVSIHTLVAAGPLVVIEWEAAGTFTSGSFRGHPPNGRAFRRKGCAVAEVRAGVIRSYRDYFDRAILLEQLGFAKPI